MPSRRRTCPARRLVANWHEAVQELSPSLITPELREALQAAALDNPQHFVDNCRKVQMSALCQLPWWDEFKAANLWEAAQIIALAADVGIPERRHKTP